MAMAGWQISSPIRIALLQAEQREAGGSPFTVRESMEYEADGSALEAPGPIVEKEFGQPLSVEDGLVLSVWCAFPPEDLRPWKLDETLGDSDDETWAAEYCQQAALREEWRAEGVRQYQERRVVRDGSGNWVPAQLASELPVYSADAAETHARAVWESVRPPPTRPTLWLRR